MQTLVEAGSSHDVAEKTTRWIPSTPCEMAESMGRADSANYLKELAIALNSVKFAAKMKMKKGGGGPAAVEAEA